MTPSEKVSEFRRRRKLNLIKVCGNKCNLCGYDKVIASLEFHHIDPAEKSYGISSKGTCHDLKKDLEEVHKCILVCANCHREIHAGQYSKEDLLKSQIFLKDVAEDLIQQRDEAYHGKVLTCSKCGQTITRDSKSGLCAKCAAYELRIVKDRPNREELKQLIQKYTFTELGRMFGVSDNSVRKWCKQVNLPFRKSDIKLIQNWDDI